MIPESARLQLREASKHLSNSQWIVGKIANELIAELTPRYNRFQVFAAIADICGLSAGRVRKIAQVEVTFPIRDESLPFGYYEAAYELPEEDRLPAIEFITFYEEEYGRRILIEELPWLYKQHIMGKDISPRPPDINQKVKEDLVRSLVKYLEVYENELATQLLNLLQELS